MPFSKPLPESISTFLEKATSSTLPSVLSSTALLQARSQRLRRTAIGIALATGALYYAKRQRDASRFSKIANLRDDSTAIVAVKGDSSKIKVAVDKRFFRQLKYIWAICVPNWRSKTVGILVLHTVFLVLRTYLSVVGARLDGRLVRDLVAADARSFGKGLGYWFALAVPATYTNSMIRYLQSKFSIALRTSLTRHVHDVYMDNNTYYKAINLDNRIDGADQLITTDINNFCTALASLYSNLGKPVLDMIIFNYQLGRSIGATGMWGLAINYAITATILRAATPAFGKLAAQQAQLEGDFRTAHSRLITNAEEIAFYHGAHLEQSILTRIYYKLIRHINHIYRIRIAYNMFEDFIIKYTWSAAGLLIASIPVFYPEMAGARSKREELRLAQLQSSDGASALTQHDHRTRSHTQGFITNKRLMVSLADAGGRIMYSYKELSELAGYTFRVFNMLRVLEDLHDEKYVHTGAPITGAPGEPDRYSLEHIKGTITYATDGLTLQNVPVATPSGDTVLVRDLSFSLGPGDHLMITGPNGSGKTSILRIIAGLWPLFAGKILRPPAKLDSIFYIPSRPYLAIGSLREQVIYPHSVKQMKAAGKTDEDLAEILRKVYLDYIPAREGGWDAVKEWKDVFSGGEKQRMQLARLFYHHPSYAILDEATSAVSTDVENLLYTTAKDLNITLITISHRPSLFKYHHRLLRVGEGNDGLEWTMEELRKEGGGGVALSVQSEIGRLEGELASVEGWKRRLEVVNRELGIGGKPKGTKEEEGELRHAKRTLI
ncbi:ABC transporter transmembrane region 2-domain-containing protein [Fimicolochytrium jonesii]|uniref:ABC transporter transmembrane region 2-domain-containing protein n=1 Tax=Fimicolochytrium jonesii TaxID=1396493 RepID=UPI0022FE9046|nr:ABC transporter transmembrane region 2-domain-containing protein [Fimicolochytrium jonesii]KAI8818923.1 ABC transporter transmembrane region 2-domain-containing protein [Fimicolochytrium jonesii]